MDNNFARRHFSAKTVKKLSKKGITVVSSMWLPDEHGSYIGNNACTGYMLSTNGAGSVKTFLEVLAIAEES